LKLHLQKARNPTFVGFQELSILFAALFSPPQGGLWALRCREFIRQDPRQLKLHLRWVEEAAART
jgi:hypothetical protein